MKSIENRKRSFAIHSILILIVIILAYVGNSKHEATTYYNYDSPVTFNSDYYQSSNYNFDLEEDCLLYHKGDTIVPYAVGSDYYVYFRDDVRRVNVSCFMESESISQLIRDNNFQTEIDEIIRYVVIYISVVITIIFLLCLLDKVCLRIAGKISVIIILGECLIVVLNAIWILLCK